MSDRDSTKNDSKKVASLPAVSNNLPPRPTETVTTETTVEPVPTRRVDPILDLFTALQTSKDRKTAHMPHMQPTAPSLSQRNGSSFPTKMIWLGLIAILLGGIALSAAKLFNRSSSKPTNHLAVGTIAAPPPATQPVPPSLHLAAPTKAITAPSFSRMTSPVNRDSDRDRHQREEEMEKDKDRDRDRERDRDRDRDRDEPPQAVAPQNLTNDPTAAAIPSTDGAGMQPPTGNGPASNRVPNSVETQ